jgi:putative ABC transport system permease protein
MMSFLQDVRFTLRMLAKSPGFTFVACLTLALGIGANTAIFSVVDAVMLRPFPYPEPERLVMAWETNPPRDIHTFTSSIPNYYSWVEQQSSFEELGAFELRNDNRTGGAMPERIQGAVATSALFRALGVAPAAGRFFLPEEDQPANRFVAVLGYDYWRQRFDGDPRAIGSSLTINGETYSVVGVAPPMRPPHRADVWRPLGVAPEESGRGNHFLRIIGRLKPDHTLGQAEADLQTIAARLQQEFPESNEGWSVRVETMFDAIVSDDTERALTVLLAAVGLLLLIACANVANLLLARSTGRYREVAIRRALGAGRGRIIGQLLTESLLLAVAGGVAGILFAVWGVELLRTLPADVPGLAEARLDGRVLFFAVPVSLLTGLVFGLAPALQTAGGSVYAHLKEGARSASPSLGRQRLRQVLVAGQIALALVLLTGAGLLLRSFERLQQVQLGFNSEQVLTAKVGLYNTRYDPFSNYVSFFDRLLADLAPVPGVEAAGVISSAPFDGTNTSMAVRLEQDAGQPAENGIQTLWRVVGGDYFRVVQVPLLRGRFFTAQDDDSASRLTIISNNLAERLWPGEDPVGRSMLVGDGHRPYQIIGVVGDVRGLQLADAPEPTMYFHYRQFGWRTMTLALRATGDPNNLTAAVRAKVAEIDIEQPVFEVRSMQDLVGQASAAPRMNTGLLGLFALLALTLAAVGVYGVMSYAVEQRTNEIGLRMALGAQTGDVLRLIVGQGLWLVGIGAIAGVLGAIAATRVLGNLLFEVSPTDPLTFAVGVVVLTAVAALSCYVPARRAMSVDPMQALRHE